MAVFPATITVEVPDVAPPPSDYIEGSSPYNESYRFPNWPKAPCRTQVDVQMETPDGAVLGVACFTVATAWSDGLREFVVVNPQGHTVAGPNLAANVISSLPGINVEVDNTSGGVIKTKARATYYLFGFPVTPAPAPAPAPVPGPRPRGRDF